MTLEETGRIMDILETAYPRFYSGPGAPDRNNALLLWAEMFAHDDAVLVAAAVKSLIETDDKGFPPHIGAVKAKLRLLTDSGEMTAAEAWSLVSAALRNSAYGAKEEFAKLPPVLQRIVGSPTQLREWGMMDTETVHSVLASNFRESYNAIARRDRELAKLPPDVKALVGKIAEEKRMPATQEKPEKLPPAQEERTAPPPKEKLLAAVSCGTGRSREEVLASLRAGQEDMLC